MFRTRRRLATTIALLREQPPFPWYHSATFGVALVVEYDFQEWPLSAGTHAHIIIMHNMVMRKKKKKSENSQ
jgi:hypothetical protein